MSTAIVRSSFRTALEAAFPSVPLIDVLGTHVDNESLPALWMAIDFSSFGQERLSIGTPCYWEETGICRVMVMGVSGSGIDTIITQADAIIDFFRNWQQAGDTLRVTAVTPASSPIEESDGKWVYVNVDMAYSRGFFA